MNKFQGEPVFALTEGNYDGLSKDLTGTSLASRG